MGYGFKTIIIKGDRTGKDRSMKSIALLPRREATAQVPDQQQDVV